MNCFDCRLIGFNESSGKYRYFIVDMEFQKKARITQEK